MRVAIFVTNAPGNYGGGRLAAYVLAQCLARAGAEVAFVTNHVPVFHADLKDFGRPGRVNIHVTKDFLTALPEGRFDAVILIPTQSLDRAVYVGARGFARRRGARLAIFNFETPNWFNAAVPVARDESLWREWKLAAGDVAENPVLVMSNSRESEKHARLWFDDPRLLFDHWHQPINLDALHRVAPQFRENRIVTFLRPRDPHKGAQDVVDVLCEEMRGWTLSVIVGSPKLDEAYRDVLTAAVRRFGMELEVRPLASDLDKFVELKRARMLLYPSWFEGYGLPPIEALSAGTPCVCYDLDVFREVCGDALVTAPVGDVGQLREGMLRVSRSSPEEWLHLPEAVASVGSVERCGLAALNSLERFLATPAPARPVVPPPKALPRRPQQKLLNLGAAALHPGWLLELRGWAALPPGSRIELFADNRFLGEAQRGMSRADVLAAQPWVGTADVGFGLVAPHVPEQSTVTVAAVARAADGTVLDHTMRVFEVADIVESKPRKPPNWWRSGGLRFAREAGSAVISGWAAGNPAPAAVEAFAGPRRLWMQGGRTRPDVLNKLDGFPEQAPGFSIHLDAGESWMLEAAEALTLVGYGEAGIAVQRLPVRWDTVTPGVPEPHPAAPPDADGLPVLAELRRVVMDEYGVLEVEGHVLSRPRVEAVRVLLGEELMGETLPDRLHTGAHNKHRAYGDAYAGFALNARAAGMPWGEVPRPVQVEFVRHNEVAHLATAVPERTRRGRAAFGTDVAFLPPELLSNPDAGVTLVAIGDPGPLHPVRGAAERALLSELRRRGPLLLLLHGNPHGFAEDLSRWQALADGVMLLNDLHPGPDALADALAALTAEPGLARILLRGPARMAALPAGLPAVLLLPGGLPAPADSLALGETVDAVLGFDPALGNAAIGPDPVGLGAALAVEGATGPEGEGPWLVLDATLCTPAALREVVARWLPLAATAGVRLLCAVDAPPLESEDALRARLALPAAVGLVWPAALAGLDPARVAAVLDLAPPGPVSPGAAVLAGLGARVFALRAGGTWPAMPDGALAGGTLPTAELSPRPYAALDAALAATRRPVAPDAADASRADAARSLQGVPA
ncbi:glycosyltransferase [Roseomonas sp. BN140053]|uniref:glycosyltransferase n=1 Tax=Roseomonas sp. BN140053 TaxID=3391898 RepID=UPI0039ECBF59